MFEIMIPVLRAKCHVLTRSQQDRAERDDILQNALCVILARIRVSKLPRHARCLILILDDPIFEQIQKYVVGNGPGLGKEDLAKRLFTDSPEAFNFHRYRILTSARPLESRANDAGELAVDIPLPSALASWGRGTTVVVFFEQPGERGGRGRQKQADQGGLFGADQ